MRTFAATLSIALLLATTSLPLVAEETTQAEQQASVLQADKLLSHSQDLLVQFVEQIEHIAQRIEQEQLTEIPERITAENQQAYNDMVEAYMCFLVGIYLFKLEAACMTDGQVESLVGNLWLNLAGPFQLLDPQAQLQALREAQRWIASHKDDSWHIPADMTDHFKPEEECITLRAENTQQYLVMLAMLAEQLEQ